MPEIQTFLRSEWAKAERELAENGRRRNAARALRIANALQAKRDALEFPTAVVTNGVGIGSCCGLIFFMASLPILDATFIPNLNLAEHVELVLILPAGALIGFCLAMRRIGKDLDSVTLTTAEISVIDTKLELEWMALRSENR